MIFNLFNLTVYILFGVLLVVTAARLMTAWHSLSRTYSVETVPQKPVAIVFGAGLRRDGMPTTVLKDRVSTGVALYQAGKVQKLLMSGDNRFDNYNEPAAMRDYAISLGVPAADIVLDYAGQSTYDTCYRARDIFMLTDVILVTQPFHLPRSLYTCNTLGVQAVGVASENYTYQPGAHLIWTFRELLATVSALIEVHLTHPLPILGLPEPIFTENNPAAPINP